ncbi:MAG: hydrolase TatD [Anaerolinea sp.]|nr:hydrolase TatD [Anaerolinea sp.]
MEGREDGQGARRRDAGNDAERDQRPQNAPPPRAAVLHHETPWGPGAAGQGARPGLELRLHRARHGPPPTAAAVYQDRHDAGGRAGVRVAFDSHAHLQDPAFERDREKVIARAEEAGVSGMLLCGYDTHSNLETLAIAAGHPAVFAAVGFHPHEAKDVTAEMLETLAGQAARPDVVAVGEIGLDFYRDHSPQDAQLRVLKAQLEIAEAVAKPVSVHSRAAEDACLEPLSAYAAGRGWAPGTPPVGIMHCFGGTLEQARRYVDVGFLISIACPITYPSNEESRRMAAGLPLEAIVVETDSPYLPPQKLRGRRNEPANVWRAIEAVAAARGESVASVAAATTHNATRIFGVTLPTKVGIS